MSMKNASVGGCLFTLAVFAVTFAGWCQHVYTCFNERLWGFLIAGAIFFPITEMSFPQVIEKKVRKCSQNPNFSGIM